MGDGRVDSTQLLAHAEAAAKRFVRFDMAQAAEEAGSVISAVLFGALAGTGVLPFSRAQFEATIERGGVGVKPSLQGFRRPRFERAAGRPMRRLVPRSRHGAMHRRPARPAAARPAGARTAGARARRVSAGARTVAARRRAPPDRLPGSGLRRALPRPPGAARGSCPADDDAACCDETARHLALWMSYEDTIRVADAEDARVAASSACAAKVRVQDDQLLAINEYMHPRLQEICETLPAGLGRWLAARRAAPAGGALHAARAAWSRPARCAAS